MATAGTRGWGCLLKKGGTTGTTVAEVVSIDGPGIDRGMVDLSNMDSASGWKEYAGGMIDPGQITCELNFLPGNTTHTALKADLTATATSYALVFNDAATTAWTFNALVQSLSPSASAEDKLGATVTFQLTGAIT